jgi:hypothetical protein
MRHPLPAPHREGNWPSKQLNERFGGRYAQTRLMQWADGQTAPALWYQIDLAAFAPSMKNYSGSTGKTSTSTAST